MGLGAKPGNPAGGRGCVYGTPERGTGNGRILPEEMEVSDALTTLDGAGGPDKLDLAVPTFPGPVAEAYYYSNADVVGICGPVGSGKTTTKMKRKLRRAMEMPRSVIDGVRRYKVMFIRHTYRELWATTIPSYLEVYPKSMGTWTGGRGDPVTHVIRFEDEHGPIEFIAEFMAFGDDPIASMRGMQTTDIDLNEADTMPVEILTVGIGRIDRWPGRQHFKGYAPEYRSYGCIDGDFNAPDEENWTHSVFFDPEKRKAMAAKLSVDLPEGAKPIEIAFFNQPGFGQPGAENLQNLGPSYYERQIATMKLGGRGDMVDRLIYNKVTYLRIGTPVFQREFNRRIHVAEDTIEVDRSVPLRLGLDQGFYGAAVVGQYLGQNLWRILAELFFPENRLMAKVFGSRLADLLASPRFSGCRVEAAWGDMAGEHGASQAADENDTWNRIVGKAAGITVRPQRIGTNRIQPRLEAVRAPLEYLDGGTPGLLIDPCCKFLIRGFEARYVWSGAPDPSGGKRKVPDKSVPEANPMDGLQYLLLSEHRPDGTAKNSFPGNRPGVRGLPLPGQPGGGQGLRVGHDVLNPYGGRA